MEFPKDRFKIYVRKSGCVASSSVLAYMAGHPLPVEIVFLDFKSRLKAIPSVEDRRDGSMKVGDEAISFVRQLAASSSLSPEELQKTFVAYVHPRSPKANQLMKTIAEISLNIDILDVEFLDYVKCTPTLADTYEKTVYNAEDALASYKDIYEEFHSLKRSAAVTEPLEKSAKGPQDVDSSLTNQSSKQFVATNPKLLAMMGAGKPKLSQMAGAGSSEAEGKKFQTEFNTDPSQLSAPPTAVAAHTKFVSTSSSFKHLMSGSGASVDTRKYQNNFETKEKTLSQIEQEQKYRKQLEQTKFVSSNPNHNFMEKLGGLSNKKFEQVFNAPSQHGQTNPYNSSQQGASAWFATAPKAAHSQQAPIGNGTRTISRERLSELAAQRQAVFSR